MNPEHISSPPNSPPALARRSPWKIALPGLGILLLLIIGAVAVLTTRATSNPVKREVVRVVAEVRAQERKDRPWYALIEKLKALLKQSRNPGGPTEDHAESLLRLGETAHPFLLPLVNNDPSPGVRRLSISVLATGNATNAFQAIARALETDDDIETRAEAANALGLLDPDAAVPQLLLALTRESNELKKSNAALQSRTWMRTRALDSVAHTLGALKATNAVEPLLGVLRTGVHEEARSSILRALGELGNPQAAPVLRGFLTAKDYSARDAAIRSLGQLRDRDALPLMLRMMEEGLTNDPAATSAGARNLRPIPPQSSNWEWEQTRNSLAEALGQIGDRQATPLLIRAVTNVVNDYELQKFIEAFAALGDPQAIPALQAIMADHPRSAGRAAAVLFLLGHQPVTRDLMTLLESSEREKRVAAALALAHLGDRTVLTNIIQTLDNGAGGENTLALIEALAIIGDSTTVQPLLDALKDASEDIRTQAIWSLGQIGDSSAAGALIQSLTDTNFSVRFAAAFSLIGMTNSAIVPALEARLNDPETRVQTAVACCLAFRGFARAVPSLAKATHRSDDWQRLAAAMSLLRLNTTEARNAASGLGSDRDAALRELARLGLERGPVAALTNMLAGGTDNHRQYAARMLLFFNDPAAKPALLAAVRDPKSEVRVAARVALRRLERKESKSAGQ